MGKQWVQTYPGNLVILNEMIKSSTHSKGQLSYDYNKQASTHTDVRMRDKSRLGSATSPAGGSHLIDWTHYLMCSFCSVQRPYKRADTTGGEYSTPRQLFSYSPTVPDPPYGQGSGIPHLVAEGILGTVATSLCDLVFFCGCLRCCCCYRFVIGLVVFSVNLYSQLFRVSSG